MSLDSVTLIRERYRVIRELGKGGFGCTYLAEDVQKKTLVALKKLIIPERDSSERIRETQYLKDLDREAKTLHYLRHDCIPQYFDDFTENNDSYIVQEYIEGHSLKSEIIPGRRLDESEIIKTLKSILVTLKFVHRHNIIHRDIKPANLIRRAKDRKIFLIDFGAAKEITTRYENSEGASLTKVIGTRGYMPLEQWYGNPQLNSDLYAVGIIALQMITDLSLDEIISSNSDVNTEETNHNYWEEEVYPHISYGLKEIVSHLIEINCKNRYQSAKKVLRDLIKLEAGEKIVILNYKITKPEEVSPNSELSTPTDLSENKTFTTVPDCTSENKPKTKVTTKSKAILLATFLISILSLASTKYIIDNFWNTACSDRTKDYISCGEEILFPYSKDIKRQKATEYYSNDRYDEAWRYFNLSWERSREAETLIYMNNTLLEKMNVDYYTLAVAVPLSYQGITPQNYRLAQNFLRGVAQAQTQVNLNLLDSYSDVEYSLPGQDFLPRKVISNAHKPKGLKIVVVDDRNEPIHTKKIAKEIASKSSILGIIGHYTSNVSLSAVEEYQQKDLAQVSFGTTTIDLSENYKSNFFRTVYTNYEEADAIVNQINNLKIPERKIAVFYNPGSTYSTDFLQEIEKRIKQQNLSNTSEKQKITIVKKFNLADEQNFQTNLALQMAKNLGVNIFVLLPDGQISNSKALERAIEIIKKDDGRTKILAGNPLVNFKVEEMKTNNPVQLTVSSFWHYLSQPDSSFTENSLELWGVDRIYAETATAYDATLVFIEALRQQDKPTRKRTLKTISAPGFDTLGSTGDITFNTPYNGDRKNFEPTIVQLINCDNHNVFIPIKEVNNQTSNLACD